MKKREEVYVWRVLRSLVGFKDVFDQRLFDGKHLRKLLTKLGTIHLVVAPRCHNDLSLFLQSEVGPFETRLDVALVHL